MVLEGGRAGLGAQFHLSPAPHSQLHGLGGGDSPLPGGGARRRHRGVGSNIGGTALCRAEGSDCHVRSPLCLAWLLLF